MGGAGAAAGAGVGGAGANGTGAGVGADSSRPSAFASANVGPDMYEALRAAGIPLTDDEIDLQTTAMARISSGGSPSPSGLRTPTGNVRLDSPPAREHGPYCSTIDLDAVTSSLSARRKDYVVDIRRSAGKIVIEGVVESRFLRLVAMPREGINTCVRRRSSGGRTKTTISFVEGVMTSDQQEQMLEGMSSEAYSSVKTRFVAIFTIPEDVYAIQRNLREAELGSVRDMEPVRDAAYRDMKEYRVYYAVSTASAACAVPQMGPAFVNRDGPFGPMPTLYTCLSSALHASKTCESTYLYVFEGTFVPGLVEPAKLWSATEPTPISVRRHRDRDRDADPEIVFATAAKGQMDMHGNLAFGLRSAHAFTPDRLYIVQA